MHGIGVINFAKKIEDPREIVHSIEPMYFLTDVLMFLFKVDKDIPVCIHISGKQAVDVVHQISKSPRPGESFSPASRQKAAATLLGIVGRYAGCQSIRVSR